jgi:leucyl aminopeptidase
MVGMGKASEFAGVDTRKAAGAAVRFLRGKSVKTVAFLLEGEMATPDHAAAAVEGAILGDFDPDRYKTGNDRKNVDSFSVAIPGGAVEFEDARSWIRRKCRNSAWAPCSVSRRVAPNPRL